MQIALHGLSSSCARSIFFQCLPCSLCWGGGRTKQAVQGRHKKPHLLTGGGVMCWWYWRQRGKVFHCLSTILIPTHSSRNSQSLLFIIIKGARNFLLLLRFPPVQNNLPLGEHPWRLNIRRALAAELWYLPAPKQSRTCSVETLWRRREKDISLPGDFHGGASVEGSECMAWIGSHCLAADRFPQPVWVCLTPVWMLRLELSCITTVGWKFGSTRLSKGTICKLLLGDPGL